MFSGRLRPLVLTLDAFGSLFHPRQPVGQQYAEVAHMHGLSGFTHQDVEASFRKAFRSARKERPNYGKAVGMNATRWWANVIHSTFSTLLPDAAPIPEGLVTSLLHRFSSDEGYRLYDDVLPFFKQLHDCRKTSPATSSDLYQLQVGIISNSDDRIPTILDKLGLRLNGRRYGSDLVQSTPHSDIHWVVMSYDVGIEKPNHGIFDAAKNMSALSAEGEGVYLHVGDSIEEDYHGALKAGWQSVLLDRDSKFKDRVPEAARVKNLTDLLPRLMESKKS